MKTGAKKGLAKRPKEIWVCGATLVTQNARRDIVKNAAIRIENGVITEISRRPFPRRQKGVQLLRADGLFILPGWVQTHVHLCQTAFRNQADDLELLDWLKKKIWPKEAAHTWTSLYRSAQTGINELLSTGTTCILDMATVRHTDAVFTAVQESGIRANVGKCLMDDPRTCPPILLESTEKALQEADDLYSRWHGLDSDRIRASYAPRFAYSCTDTLLRKVAERSQERRALVHTHANENRGEIAAVQKRSGLTNIEYLAKVGLAHERVVLAHGVWLSRKEIQILKKTQTRIAHCPGSNLKLASGVAPVPELMAQKVPVSLGCDGAACNNSLNMLTEMRLAALVHKPKGGPRAMPATLVLDMATREGAKALHWFDQIGSVEVGKRADLIALNLSAPDNQVEQRKGRALYSAIASAIVYSTQAHHLKWTMVDGRLLYRAR